MISGILIHAIERCGIMEYYLPGKVNRINEFSCFSGVTLRSMLADNAGEGNLKVMLIHQGRLGICRD